MVSRLTTAFSILRLIPYNTSDDNSWQVNGPYPVTAIMISLLSIQSPQIRIANTFKS